ncbi:DMT family transporter [Roseovarius sp. SYSU LYC5161]|uniref:DMT family transporter n=1 Tax=Roseovarius halophilus (ex Wu et al. 2025) TaxID=3376060 RepID=UPI002870DCB0|nr:DMT family transporter [Roseovarius sp.]
MDNLRGGALMILAMAGFALEDMFVKRLTGSLSVGLVLILLGAGGALVFGVMALARGHRLFSRDLISRPVLLRNFGELVATLGFVTALALTPISSASAILQATPLAVTLGAALFLGEPVGWRRWSAIIVGFTGVLMIIRPGLQGFQPASLFAVQAVVGLAIRDLATRATPRTVTTLQLASYAFATLVPAGVLMLFIWPGSTVSLPTPANWRDLSLALLFGVFAYYAIVAAMRVGDVSYVTPFRYTRLVFALIIGVTVFAERPDGWTLTGAALIVATGLYSVIREARLRRRIHL